MPDNSLHLGVDFAALRTFRLVYEQRSFTAAAVELGVNQSAVSYTIDKLRKTFADPLFFRQGGQLIATERCQSIAGPIVQMLEDFTQLTEPVGFDPASADHTLIIACNYYERQIILPHIIRSLRDQAPGIRLETITSTATGDKQLKSGQADLLIGPIRPDEPDFYCRKLVDEHYVCAADPANPILAGKLTRPAYLSSRHAVVNYGGGWRSGYLVDVERKGGSLNQVLSVPSPAGLSDMVAGTDLITAIPSRIAETFKNRLAVTDCPFPAPFAIHLVWTTRTHRSPMFSWVRELISLEVAANVQPVP